MPHTDPEIIALERAFEAQRQKTRDIEREKERQKKIAQLRIRWEIASRPNGGRKGRKHDVSVLDMPYKRTLIKDAIEARKRRLRDGQPIAPHDEPVTTLGEIYPEIFAA